MSNTATVPTEIDDPHAADGWRSFLVHEQRVHDAVLHELCSQGVPLIIGGAGGHPFVRAALQTVDELNRQLVFVSSAEPLAVARAILPLPLWAAAYLQQMRVQLGLAGATCRRDGARTLVQTAWPQDIYRVPRRRVVRHARAPQRAPVVRFHRSNQLGATREHAVIDISESGCAVLLAAGTPPPAVGTCICRIELELDDQHIVFTDATVQHVTPMRRGTHRLGCRWEGMPAAAQRTLMAWLAATSQRAALAAPA